LIKYGERLGDPNTGRGLGDLDARLGVGIIEAAIERRLQASGHCRVLEIGCGEGRVLMELRSRFPDAELHGVNQRPWPAMRGSESLPAVAAFFEVPPPQAADVPLPAIHFCDAAAMPLPDDHFDLIFSQATFHFIRNKHRALEEIFRVLKPGGEAHVQMDSTAIGTDSCFPRFVIEAAGRRVATTDFLTRGLGNLVHCRWEWNPGRNGGRITVMRAVKTNSGRVRLGLSLDEGRSRLLTEDDRPIQLHYGYYSVFTAEA
jgi:SAM-dependent methyltransferase